MNTASIQLPIAHKEPRVRRAAQVTDQLRQLIFDGKLKPGDRLPTEDALCQHFSVSRTTLRESVQMLRASGLLEVTPGRGSFVRVPDLANLLNDLVLFSRCNGVDNAEVLHLLNVLLLESLPKVCKAALEKRRKLTKFNFDLGANVETNLDNEREWLLAILELGANSTAVIFLSSLLSMLQTKRRAVLTNREEFKRLSGLQLRINSAIADGEHDMVARMMAAYLG